MKGLAKWFLAVILVLTVLSLLDTSPAEAARWRVYAWGYPAYRGPYVYHGAYYHGPYWAPPPPVAVYRGPVLLPRPVLRPVYRPVVVPYRAHVYWAW